MSELGNTHSDVNTPIGDASKTNSGATEDTVVNYLPAHDTIPDSELSAAELPASSETESRFEKVNLRVTIDGNSLKVVLGSKASSVAKKLAAHFSSNKDKEVATVNLRAKDKAFRLRVMENDLTGERLNPPDQELMGVVTFKRVGNEILVDALQDVNGREVPAFRIIRNVILAERAVARKENEIRESLVHEAKFDTRLIESRSLMPGNVDMQNEVRTMLVGLDAALQSLLNAEVSKVDSPKWALAIQSLQADLQENIHTVCPCIDAFLLAFSAKTTSTELVALRQDEAANEFLNGIQSVRFLDRSTEARHRRKLRAFVTGLRKN